MFIKTKEGFTYLFHTLKNTIYGHFRVQAQSFQSGFRAVKIWYPPPFCSGASPNDWQNFALNPFHINERIDKQQVSQKALCRAVVCCYILCGLPEVDVRTTWEQRVDDDDDGVWMTSEWHADDGYNMQMTSGMTYGAPNVVPMKSHKILCCFHVIPMSSHEISAPKTFPFKEHSYYTALLKSLLLTLLCDFIKAFNICGN